jgi:hypothetical protein
MAVGIRLSAWTVTAARAARRGSSANVKAMWVNTVLASMLPVLGMLVGRKWYTRFVSERAGVGGGGGGGGG